MLLPLDKRIRMDTMAKGSSSARRQEFQDWLDRLRDLRAQVRIAARLRLAEAGNLGDWKPVGGEVSEMRVDIGPGYRLYFTRKGSILIVMLAGGDKSTQACDIKRAQRILNQLEPDL
jgi:putative addiction module killer protein